MTEVRLAAATAWVIAAQAMLAVMVAVAAAIAAVVIAAAAGSTIRLREKQRKRLGPARQKLCYEIFVRPKRNRASLYLSFAWQ